MSNSDVIVPVALRSTSTQNEKGRKIKQCLFKCGLIYLCTYLISPYYVSVSVFSARSPSVRFLFFSKSDSSLTSSLNFLLGVSALEYCAFPIMRIFVHAIKW